MIGSLCSCVFYIFLYIFFLKIYINPYKLALTQFLFPYILVHWPINTLSFSFLQNKSVTDAFLFTSKHRIYCLIKLNETRLHPFICLLQLIWNWVMGAAVSAERPRLPFSSSPSQNTFTLNASWVLPGLDNIIFIFVVDKTMSVLFQQI